MAFQHSPRLAAYPLAMPPRLYPVAVPVSPPKQQQQQGEFSKGERTWTSILGNVTITAAAATTTALAHNKDGEKEKHGSRRVMGSSRRYALLPLQQQLQQQKQQRPTFGMRRRVTTPV